MLSIALRVTIGKSTWKERISGDSKWQKGKKKKEEDE